MKIEAEEAEIEPLMPMVETISRRIRLERLVVLEKAVEKIDQEQNAKIRRASFAVDSGAGTKA